MNFNKNKPITFVALSGGVDSAVATILIKDQYPNVIGISHMVWPNSNCCLPKALDNCQIFADSLGISYFKLDLMVDFSKKVIDKFINTYFNGKTPNPCIWCNEKIRFDFMIKKFYEKFDISNNINYKLVTGHYAQIKKINHHYYLKKAKDKNKDQSYMLYRLNQKQLANTIFPLGSLLKSEVRKIAKDKNLISANIKDSQDICFVNSDLKSFFEDYTQKKCKTGDITDIYGKILGKHNGICFYTRGQRRGLNLSNGPWFVIDIDATNNKIIVGNRKSLLKKKIKIKNLNLIIPDLKSIFKAEIQTRYHAPYKKGQILLINKNTAIIEFNEPTDDISLGQSAVFYDGDYVIGGGIIDEILD